MANTRTGPEVRTNSATAKRTFGLYTKLIVPVCSRMLRCADYPMRGEPGGASPPQLTRDYAEPSADVT